MISFYFQEERIQTQQMIKYLPVIIQGFNNCLTQTITQYEIDNEEEISDLSLLCDLTAMTIEAKMLAIKSEQKKKFPKEYNEELHPYNGISFFHYPKGIKEAVYEALKIYKFSIGLKAKNLTYKMTDDHILEELVDNIALEIEIYTNSKNRIRNQ